jgi:hypothetical protein
MHATPPRYGIEMSKKSRGLMKYAILAHLIIGFFMFSNTAVF